MNNDHKLAIDAFNTLKKYLQEEGAEPYHLATIPTQWIERDELNKKPLADLEHAVDSYIVRISSMLEAVRKQDPHKTGILHHDVAQNAQHLAGLLYILHERTPLPEKPNKTTSR
jgi:hypothetical protein